MIEGTKLRIKSDVLLAHCQTRQAFHERKAAQYAKAGGKVKGALAEVEEEEIEEMGKLSYNSSDDRNDPQKRMREHARNHAKRAGYFGMYATHLIVSEVYQFTENEAMALELDIPFRPQVNL